MLVTLNLPITAKLLVKAGQKITTATAFYENKIEVMTNVPVAKILNVSPKKIFNHLRKFVGDSLTPGDLIGLNKGMFTTKKIYSEYNGIIKEIDHFTGNVIIAATGDVGNTEKAFFIGEVAEIKKNTVVIDLKKAKEYPLSKTTRDFGGKVAYKEFSDKIFLKDSITPYEQSKAEAIGATGFISLTSLPESTELPNAQIKVIDDYKKIVDLQFPYCLVSRVSSTIYFYHE